MNYKKMKALREQKQLSQKQLAEQTMVGQTMIAQIETGDKAPSLALLGRIANALGVRVAELL